MRYLIGLVFLSLCSLAHAHKLDYVFKITNSKPSKLNVRLNFQLPGINQVFLSLPAPWGGHTELHKLVNITNIVGAEAYSGNQPHNMILVFPTGGKVTIDYELVSGVKGLPNTLLQSRQPILSKDFIYFFGTGALVYPILPEDAPLDVTLNWQLPAKWHLANSFGVDKSQQRFTTTLIDLVTSMYLAGDLRLYSENLSDGKLYLALKGKWRFQDKAMLKTISKVVRKQREFFQTGYSKNFLAAVLPVNSKASIMAGLGLHNSFALLITKKFGIDKNMISLIEHEMLHNWNSAELFAYDGKNQETKYWFTEGFTDYFANLLALRSGLITLQEYIALYNDIIAAYYLSPVKRMPNSAIGSQIWQDYAVLKLPYQRGNIYAHYLNAEIKNSSANKYNFDLVFKSLINSAIEQQKITFDDFHTTVKTYLRNYSVKQFDSWILAGDELALHPDALGSCVVLGQQEIKKIDLGFDVESSVVAGKIVGVNKRHTAYRVGIRNGQKLINVDYNPNFPKKDIVVTIKQYGAPKHIKYRGHTSATMQIPQYKLKLYTAGQDCLRWFF